ncbi:NTP transferase domain-containing protein [Planktomarina temperata]|nr:NTP transferase domain-containing protein [Planktomarina temperata]
MEKNFIILAGGQGTRLREVMGAQNMQKCLISLDGKRPHLINLISDLLSQNQQVYLALSHGSEAVIESLKEHGLFDCVNLDVSPELLGTGGAALAVMKKCELDEAVVINGDTIYSKKILQNIITYSINASLTAFVCDFERDNHKEGEFGQWNIENSEYKYGTYQSGNLLDTGILSVTLTVLESLKQLKFPVQKVFSSENIRDIINIQKIDGDFYDFGTPYRLKLHRKSIS